MGKLTNSGPTFSPASSHAYRNATKANRITDNLPWRLKNHAQYCRNLSNELQVKSWFSSHRFIVQKICYSDILFSKKKANYLSSIKGLQLIVKRGLYFT